MGLQGMLVGASWEMLWELAAGDILIVIALLWMGMNLFREVRRRPHSPFMWQNYAYGMVVVLLAATFAVRALSLFYPVLQLLLVAKMVAAAICLFVAWEYHVRRLLITEGDRPKGR